MQWFDPGGDERTDRVIVPRRVIGEMGMKTLHSNDQASHSPGRPMGGIGGNRGVALSLVAAVGSGHLCRQVGIFVESTLHRLDAAGPFESPNPFVRQRASEPKPGWKRRTVIENGRDADDRRKTERTTGTCFTRRPQWTFDLGRRYFTVDLTPGGAVWRAVVIERQDPRRSGSPPSLSTMDDALG